MDIKYSVTLSNRDCIFDSAGGFNSVTEALEWASGRGGTYGVGLDKEVNGVLHGPGITLSATQRGNKTAFAIREIGGWRNVSPDEIATTI